MLEALQRCCGCSAESAGGEESRADGKARATVRISLEHVGAPVRHYVLLTIVIRTTGRCKGTGGAGSFVQADRVQ